MQDNTPDPPDRLPGELPLDFAPAPEIEEPRAPFRAETPEPGDAPADTSGDAPVVETAGEADAPAGETAPASRRPVPMITPRQRTSAVQSLNSEVRGPVVSLSASQLPGAPKQNPDLPYGRIFAEARRKQGLSLEQVDDATLIRSDYVRAFEEEDASRLPPPAYVVAYARRLGKLYKMPSGQVDELVEAIRAKMEYTVPEELLSRLEESGDPSEENIRAMRKFMIAAGVAAGLLVLIVSGIIIAAGAGAGHEAAAPRQALPDSFAGKYIGAPALEIPPLPVR